MASPLYKGYSTVANQGVQTDLQNIALVNQDLLNQFNTRLDERPMRPRWGRIIHDLLFDLGDSRTESLIVQDAQRIVASDPRVKLISISPNVNLDAGSVRISMLLHYVEFDMDAFFQVAFKTD